MSNDRVIDYAIKIARGYDVQLVILDIDIIRADASLHNVYVPNHIMDMKEQA